MKRLIILIVLLISTAQDHAADAAENADAATVAAIEKIGGSVRPLGDGFEVRFHLRGRQLTGDGLMHVAALNDVVELNLRDTKITNTGLAHLKGLTKMRRLHLERTEIGDEGVVHLADLTNLEYLNLYATKITDKSLASLAGLKRLKRLYVWQTDVTDNAVAQLERALPQLNIVRGVDLTKLPDYSESEPETVKPKEDLQWVVARSVSDAPRSQSGLNTQVFFENRSKQRVKLYWVSYGNELKLYAELDPGATRQQNSYSRNTWLITDTNDIPLGYFIVTQEISRAVIPAEE